MEEHASGREASSLATRQVFQEVLHALSASTNVLKGDPVTRMAPDLVAIERQVARKPIYPWKPRPVGLS